MQLRQEGQEGAGAHRMEESAPSKERNRCTSSGWEASRSVREQRKHIGAWCSKRKVNTRWIFIKKMNIELEM